MKKLFISLITVAILSFSFLFITPQDTHACSCFSKKTYFEMAERVFLGHVIDVKETKRFRDDGRRLSSNYDVTFSVPIIFKGHADPIEHLTTFEYISGNCGGGPIHVGDEFVLAIYNEKGATWGYDFMMCQMAGLDQAESYFGPGKYVGSVCPQCKTEIPVNIQQRALRYPHEFRDWGKRGGAPFYSWYTWLSLQNPNQAYHPLFNSAVWKSGCY